MAMDLHQLLGLTKTRLLNLESKRIEQLISAGKELLVCYNDAEVIKSSQYTDSHLKLNLLSQSLMLKLVLHYTIRNNLLLLPSTPTFVHPLPTS
jgi:hypothetical protein